MTHRPLGMGRFIPELWLQQAQKKISPDLSASPAAASQSAAEARDWSGVKLALMLLALPWTGAAAAYHWLATVPESPTCQTPRWSQAEFEQLQCLQVAMQSSETQALVAGLRQLKAWPETSPMHSVAQRLLEDWSVVAWSEAQARFEAGQWEDSARLIAAIPEEFELWTQVRQRSTLWQTVREQGDALYQQAKAAIQNQDWSVALEHAQELAGLDNDYWRKQGLHELPTLIEEQQAAAQGQPVALSAAPHPQETQEGPAQLPTPPAAQMSAVAWTADPRSAQRSHLVAPPLISLTRPSVVQPGQRPPEFSAV